MKISFLYTYSYIVTRYLEISMRVFFYRIFYRNYRIYSLLLLTMNPLCKIMARSKASYIINFSSPVVVYFKLERTIYLCRSIQRNKRLIFPVNINVFRIES